MRKIRVKYGLSKNELRQLNKKELELEYAKWVDLEKSFKGNRTSQLICTRVQNKIIDVYNEKYKH